MFSRGQELILAVLMAVSAAAGVLISRGSLPAPELFGRAPDFFRVSLNTADWAELDLLPGLGPQRAREIVAYRDEHGPFKEWDDLLNIKGLGESGLAKLRKAAALD